ncbi:MAG: mechanosensitive ion channel [Dehalococcoidia bacterium]|nr:mechanosensitive ion channel [Dehalococcoidia bacterium]
MIAEQVLGGTRWPLLLVLALYLGSLVLTLPDHTRRPVDDAALLAFLLQSLLWGNRFIAVWVERYHHRQLAEDAGTATRIASLGFVAKLALYTAVSLLALDNFGIQITALVAGLGIGGIAVALAAQNVLGDLFASLAITLDKPFVLGDFIIAGEEMGTVERIGLKTTHVRRLSGEQIIFGNQDF